MRCNFCILLEKRIGRFATGCSSLTRNKLLHGDQFFRAFRPRFLTLFLSRGFPSSTIPLTPVRLIRIYVFNGTRAIKLRRNEVGGLRNAALNNDRTRFGRHACAGPGDPAED